MLKKKSTTIQTFFRDVPKVPGEVTPEDIRNWCSALASAGIKPATIYTRVSFVSSFYDWAQRAPELKSEVTSNPVILARPKAPKPYQSESSKAWTDEELRRIVDVVTRKAATDDLIGKRDLALLLLFTSTGWRREEVISLRGKDVRILDDKLIIGGRVKGGRYRAREVSDPETKAALLDYLATANRSHILKTDGALWTRHDNPRMAGEPLTSHAFARNLKLYARAAGLEHAHVHQTRHTFARIVSEETGSFVETQGALEHQNLHTTTAYVQRIGVKKDVFSQAIARRRQSRS
jgi:site-specific recombinase XerD